MKSKYKLVTFLNEKLRIDNRNIHKIFYRIIISSIYILCQYEYNFKRSSFAFLYVMAEADKVMSKY
jgi:hypothetical protein